MTYIWDTNIIIHAVRKPLFLEMLSEQYDFSNSLNALYISAVTIGEVHSISLRNGWGKRKTDELERII